MATLTAKKYTSEINASIAFRLGDNILEKWGCSSVEKQAILQLKKSSYHRYQKDNNSASLSSDQLERISYLANIHDSLRSVFSNPENVYSFMKMKNENAYFNGRTPLSIINSGNFGALYEVFKRIDAMRNSKC